VELEDSTEEVVEDEEFMGIISQITDICDKMESSESVG